MPIRPHKITLGEMRSSGVRGLLVYCGDYKCAHSVAIDVPPPWPDHVRLSDLEPKFTCQAWWAPRRRRPADVRTGPHGYDFLGGALLLKAGVSRTLRKGMPYHQPQDGFALGTFESFHRVALNYRGHCGDGSFNLATTAFVPAHVPPPINRVDGRRLRLIVRKRKMESLIGRIPPDGSPWL
jgi:hypothetical protein